MMPRCSRGVLCRIGAMELTWYGRTCVRLRGRDAVVVDRPVPVDRRADRPRDHRRHRHLQPPRRRPAAAREGQDVARRAHAPALEPGRRVRPRRPGRVRGQGRPGDRRSDLSRRRQGRRPAASRSRSSSRSTGIHTIHLGDIGHLLSEEKLGDIGSVDIALRAARRALTPTRAAALVAQLDPSIVVPMPLCEDEADCAEALKKFFHEMGAEPTDPAEAVGHRDQPAGGDDGRPPRIARQAGLTPEPLRSRSPQARSRTTRPRLTTVRTRSAAGQYGIWSVVGTRQIDEVGDLAGLERPDLVLEAEGPGGVDRDRGERLVGGQPQLDTGRGHRQRQARRRRRARD